MAVLSRGRLVFEGGLAELVGDGGTGGTPDEEAAEDAFLRLVEAP
jgi:hypothetical protein